MLGGVVALRQLQYLGSTQAIDLARRFGEDQAQVAPSQLGMASSIKATTPVTVGAADEVPFITEL